MDDYERHDNQRSQQELEEDEVSGTPSLIPLQVSQNNFYGDELLVVLVEVNGERLVMVPLRQFCEYLGVDWSGQYQRVKRDEILAREMMSVVVTQTQIRQRGYYNRPTLCLPLDLLPGWLFNINPSRVKQEYRERVQRYRGLCYRALWRAFQRGNCSQLRSRPLWKHQFPQSPNHMIRVSSRFPSRLKRFLRSWS